MSRRISSDWRGVEGIPMKLLVIMIAVAFIVPAVYHGLSVNAERQAKEDIESAMNDLATAIRFVYGQGTLESREVTLDFSSSKFSGMEVILIGDRVGEHPGVNQSTISYKYWGVWEHIVVTDPNIPITSPDNCVLELGGYGKWDLIIQKNTIGFTDFVVVREKGQGGEVKMPDLYVGSISVLDNPPEDGFEVDDDTWEEYKPQMMTQFVPPGYQVSAVIKNIGNLATDDPNSKWVDGIGKDVGVVRVRFIDYLIDRNETRQIGESIIIDHLGPDEEIAVSAKFSDGEPAPWRIVDYLYYDDAFDRTLLNRKVIAQVDFIEYDVDEENETSEMSGGDNIDEINGKNNNREYLHIEIPPVINSVEAQYDDPDPGIGVFVRGIEVFNKFTINATDENGFVWQTLLWYGDDEFSLDPYKRDIPPTQILMEKAGDIFITYINMGGINGTSNLTIAAIDNAGVGSDPYNTAIYMEFPPRWMENTDEATRATAKETGKRDDSFTPSTSGDATGGNGNTEAQLNYFTLKLELPQTLNDGKQAPASDDTPYVAGQNNQQSEKYVLELKIPIGGEISFGKEKTLKSNVMGMEVTGRAYIDAAINVGFPDIEVNLSKIFDLIREGKYLISNWNQFGPMLKDTVAADGSTIGELWKRILKPNNATDLMNALNETRSAAENESQSSSKDYSGLTDSISNIVEIVEEYQETFETMKDVWGTIMDIAENPASMRDLVSFEATVGAEVGGEKEWDIFSAKYPIMPPVLTATVDVAADFSAMAHTEAGISATLSGVEFGYVEAGFELGLGLTLRCSIRLGIDFGIGGGGIEGWIEGRPQLTLDTGFRYETPTINVQGETTAGGFSPFCNGEIDVTLAAGLGAYVEFLWFTKTWTFWEGSFTLGNWGFDVFEGTDSGGASFVKPEEDLDALADEDGTINFPTGPATATFNGRSIVVTSKDLNNDFHNPDYQIQARADGPMMWPSDILTSNNRIKIDPQVIYNHTGSAFVVWNEGIENQDLTSTDIGLVNFMNDAELKYAIINENNELVHGPATIYTKTSGSDLQPSLVLMDDDNITITWIHDIGGDIMTTNDQRTMFSIWNGTNWTAPAIKFLHGSFHYDNKMVSLPDGDLLSIWTRDGDEIFNTYDDQQIVYSIFNGTNWTDYKFITSDNLSVDSTSLAVNGDNVILTWLAIDWEDNCHIKYCTYNIVADTWSSIKLVNHTTRPVQFPQVVVNPDGLAAVVWKGSQMVNMSSARESGIFYSTIDLEGDDVWS